MLLSKKEVSKLLKEKKYDELIKISSSHSKILTTLISLSYDKKNPVSWRAMESTGLITGKFSKSKPELVRNLAGRLLWMLRDESGGIGWSAPEILGEIVRNCPVLCADIAPLIVSFHKEKMLTPGVLWAIGRMGKSNTEMVDYAVPIVLDYLQNTDNTIRGYAARALGDIGTSEIVKDLEKLKNDRNHIPVYENGELSEKTIGKIAEEAIERIKS